MKKITLQQMFDGGLKQIVEQGGPSFNRSNDECFYRHGAKRCHIGAFIPDNHYSNEFEGDAAYVLPAPIKSMFTVDGLTLNAFQDVHDDAAREGRTKKQFFAIYREKMIAFARARRLKLTKLKKLLPVKAA